MAAQYIAEYQSKLGINVNMSYFYLLLLNGHPECMIQIWYLCDRQWLLKAFHCDPIISGFRSPPIFVPQIHPSEVIRPLNSKRLSVTFVEVSLRFKFTYIYKKHCLLIMNTQCAAMEISIYIRNDPW